MVLSNSGGVFPKLRLLVKSGLGSTFGNGYQYVPWIHISDLVQIFVYAIENEHVKGVFNAVAPEQVTNKQIIEMIAYYLNKRLWLPNIPERLLKLLFGEMSGMLLYGKRVSCKKLLETGFEFNLPKLDTAICQLLSNSKH